MNYVETIRQKLDERLQMTNTPYEGLLDLYGLLVLVKGKNCTKEDIHDAWSFWQNRTDAEHRSLKPFNELSEVVKELDEEYRQAVVSVADEIKNLTRE